MSDALSLLNPTTLASLEKVAGDFAKSSLMPDSLKGKPQDVFVILMTGAELGIQPLQAIRGISVIKGRPSLSADLLVSLVKQRRDVCEYLQLVKCSPSIVTYRAKRVGEEPTEMSFTMEDAQRAGLAQQDNYRKHPSDMLRARCASKICRAVWPDVALGLYDSDSGELTDGKTEKDITPSAPVARGPDAVKAALSLAPAAAQLVVEAKPLATEIELAPSDELRTKVMEGEAWMQKNPSSKKIPQMKAKLESIKAELSKREPVEEPDEFGVLPEPGSDVEAAL